jgi:hypothetical protein
MIERNFSHARLWFQKNDSGLVFELEGDGVFENGDDPVRPVNSLVDSISSII